MFIFKALLLGQSLIQATCGLFAVGFLGTLFGFAANIIGGGKAKKAAKKAAEDAAKQRAHELRMAQLASQAQEVQSKKTQILLLAGGGFALVALFIFMKKR